MKLFKTIILSVFLSVSATYIHAQESIASDDFNTCSTMLNDTNETQPYGPNEDETLTICPEAPETVLNLYWVSFDLGAGDMMRIYDGPTVGSPLIGEYTGQQLALQDVTSTNPSGCITLHWTSDANNEGDFGAVVTCGAPCAKPFVVLNVTGESDQPILACQSQTFTLDASSTVFAPGASFQSVSWDFGDGTTANSGWPSVQKIYENPGSYRVNLHVTDNNGCTNLNVVDVRFFVSTTPVITAVSDDNLVCVGQEVNFSGSVQSVPFVNVPDVDFGNGVFIPDNQGCFSDTLWATGFPGNLTVTNINDLTNVYVNYEHSFMSDFTIAIICPDGSSVALHSQGGSGTWLGHPCDNTIFNATGEGLDYWWSPSVTSPTWAQAVSQGGYTTPYYDPCTNQTGSSLNSGTYAAVGNWQNLIGCPLNGPWVIQVCDIVGQDDGYIYSWGVEFNSSLYPDDMSFTPTFGASCDSTYWLGSNIVDNGGFCDTVVVVPTAAGNHNYSYVVIDNHGCVYSQSVSIQAYEGPIVNAGDDFYYCGGQNLLTGVVTNPQQGIQYNYSWNNGTYLTNSNTASTNILANAFNQTTEFVLSVYPTDDPNCLVHDAVLAIVPAYPPSVGIDSLRICIGESSVILAPTQEQSPYSYQWYYSPDSLAFSIIENEIARGLVVNAGGFYEVYVTEPNCGFTSITPFWIEALSCQVIYPNVFTPNGDGHNDMFVVDGILDLPGSSLIIYNRWGQKVYENTDYRNDWTGDDLAEGVYYYVAEINKPSGKDGQAGYFHLVRK